MKFSKPKPFFLVVTLVALATISKFTSFDEKAEVGSEPCRSVSQGVGRMFCLPKTAWPPTCQLTPEARRG